jgi:hypothetical protein
MSDDAQKVNLEVQNARLKERLKERLRGGLEAENARLREQLRELQASN